jgi:hypothetical protein
MPGVEPKFFAIDAANVRRATRQESCQTLRIDHSVSGRPILCVHLCLLS